MRFVLISLFIFLASGIFFGVIPVQAAGGLVPCDGPDCRACDLVTFGQKLLTWFISTMAAVIALIFAWGGMKMVMSGGSSEGVSEAKSMMTNSVIGFLIMLSAWLVVDTVLKAVVSDDKDVKAKFGTWNQIECIDLPERVATPTGGVVPGGYTPSGTGNTKVMVRDANGKLVEVALNTTQTDQSLASNFAKVYNEYTSEINSVCHSTGSTIPDCTKVVTALIANESRGKIDAVSPTGALGIMQLIPENGGAKCSEGDTGCIKDQISIGVKKLNDLYSSNSAVGKSLPNALAAYNSGEATGDNSSVSGKKPALGVSSDCPGLRAYQCEINAGGLKETQGYVANICKTLTIHGGGC